MTSIHSSPPLRPLFEAHTAAAQNGTAYDAEQAVTSNDLNTEPATTMSSATPHQGFQDATGLLFSACNTLRLGQMVAMSNFSLMDSMAAVKIMDARMDSGMELPASELPESERLDDQSANSAKFDPFQALTAGDVLWIMDRLLACEASWHQGSGLSQTLYTCLYFHSINSLSAKHPRFQQQPTFTHEKVSSEASQSDSGSSNSDQPPRQLVYKVLRAFILATIKTIDIAWSELTSKQHLHDGEDFLSDKNGLSLLETTDAGYAIAELEDALEWLQSQQNALRPSEVESLKARLNFRKQMLYAVRLLQRQAEAAPLDVVMHTKFARRNWSLLRPSSASAPDDRAPVLRDESPTPIRKASEIVPLQLPGRNAAPSIASICAFDPAYSRRLTWCQALRPISLPSPTDTWRILDGILEELQDVVHVLQHPGFLTWKTFFSHRAVRYQTSQPFSATPYIRSLMQTAVCDRNMIASRLPLDWLTETFFQEIALIDPLLLRRASRIGRNNIEGGSNALWNAPPPLGQRVHYFVQRVAGQLVQYLSTLSQNRARCKRTLASRVYREWVHISEEASEIGRQLEAELAPDERYIPDSLFAGTQHLALEIMTQITFSGFELDLYGHGTDRESMWWLASRIQVEQKVVCTDLRDELSKALELCAPELKPRRYLATIIYLSRQIHLAQALQQLAISTIFLTHYSQRVGSDSKAKTQSYEWLLSSADKSSRFELEKAVFATRVKWTRTASPNRSGSDDPREDSIHDTLWQEYLAFRDELEATDDATLSALAKDRLDKAIMHLVHLMSTFAGEQRQELGAQGFRDFASSLLASARHNRDTLEMVLIQRTDLQVSGNAALSPMASTIKVIGAWTFEHPWIPKWSLSDVKKDLATTP